MKRVLLIFKTQVILQAKHGDHLQQVVCTLEEYEGMSKSDVDQEYETMEEKIRLDERIQREAAGLVIAPKGRQQGP
jgi:hypothetical protein